jgi:FKBP-type peptidyl-prolyl cis-trans isomerase
MLKVALLLLLSAGVLSTFSPELISKYSIKVLAEGREGTEPTRGDTVKMHYDGRLKDGTKFDSSYERGEPLSVSIGRGQVIRCWDEVGVHMRVG